MWTSFLSLDVDDGLVNAACGTVTDKALKDGVKSR